MRDVVDKLKMKAISKIREYLLHKIYQFRKPMTNYHMTQNQLLNYKYAFIVKCCLDVHHVKPYCCGRFCSDHKVKHVM